MSYDIGPSWDELYETVRPQIIGAARKVCPSWCDPDDLINQAFARLAEEIADLDFESPDEVAAWLEAEVQRIADSR